MANYNVNISHIFESELQSFITFATPSTSLSSPRDVDSGDTVTFINSGSSTHSVSISSFNSNIWTSTANLNLAPGASSVKTTKVTAPDGTIDTLFIAAINYHIRTNISADTTPDAFNIGSDITNAQPGEIFFSSFNVAGINAASTISITGTGATYNINGGSYTSSNGSVNNGDTIQLRHEGPVNYNASRTATITIGGVSDSRTVTTVAADTTPDAFNVGSNVTNAALSTNYDSLTVTVGGLSVGTSVSVSTTNGTYSKNGGAYTAVSGNVVNGDTLVLRIQSSSSPATPITGTLNIGGVTDSRTVTTLAADTTPDAFDIGADVTGAATNAQYTSSTITVSGINTSVSLSVTNGVYSKNFSPYGSASGTAVAGDQVTFRMFASSNFSTAKTGTLTIGGTSDSRTITTGSADTSPDPFNVGADVTNAALSTNYTSSVTVSGINTSVSVSVTGASYSINGGAYTTSAGTVSNGDSVSLRITSSASFSTQVIGVLTIGDQIDSRRVTTLDGDSTPNAFNVGADVTGASLSTNYDSSLITISGINVSASVSATNGSYSKNGGAYTSSSGSVVNGDTLVFRIQSSSSPATGVTGTLNVGGVTDSRTITTLAADTTPDTFDVGADVSGAALSTSYYSSTFTVSGINTSVSVSVTNATYSKNGAGYTSASGSVVSGDTLRLRIISSASYSTAKTGTLTVGTISDSRTITTQAEVATFVPLGINSGTIKLSDLNTFFGGTKLTDYYRGGTYVPDITENNGVPISGNIRITDFYGSGKTS